MAKSKSAASAVYGGPGLSGMSMGQSQPQAQAPAKETPKVLVPKESKMTLQGLPMYSAMMADPLHATPVGKPDFNAVATLPNRFRDVYTITTNAAGEYYGLFLSGPYLGNYANATITGGNVTDLGTNTSSGYQAALVNDFSSVRTLCFVVEWLPTLSDQNASGRIFLGQYNTSSTSGVPVQSLDAFFDDEGMVCSAKQWAGTIARPSGDLPFHAVNANDNAGIFPQVAVVITGMPAIAQKVGQIIVTRIVEGVPLGTTLAKGRATHTPCDMTDCCCAANLVGPSVTYSGNGDKWASLVAKAMKVAKVAVRLGAAYSTSGASELQRIVAQAGG